MKIPIELNNCQAKPMRIKADSWHKDMDRCDECGGLIWRLKNGSWTHRKKEWREQSCGKSG